MAQVKSANKRKYGTKAQYAQARKIKSMVNKLKKRGVISSLASDETRILKSGSVVVKSSAVRRALDDFHEALSGGAKIYKLTKKQAKALGETYSHLPESQRPTVKNNRVLVGQGNSLYTKGGNVRIEKSNTKEISNTLFLTGNWQDKIREFARKNPGKLFGVKRTDRLNNFTRFDTYPTDGFGPNMLISKIMAYDWPSELEREGASVTLLLDSTLEKRVAQNKAKKEEDRKAAQREKNQRAKRSRKAKADKIKAQIERDRINKVRHQVANMPGRKK